MSGFVLWLTGLSGAGKTTICKGINELAMKHLASRAVALDSDVIRQGLSSDLGFSPEDRRENARRVAHLAALLADLNFAVTVALISPYKADRERAKGIIGADRFRLVHVKAPVEICEERDTKGVYRRARLGEIQDFTGVSAPYEPPENPDIVVDTTEVGIEEGIQKVWGFIDSTGLLSGGGGI